MAGEEGSVAARERLIEWLDGLLADEPAPEGLAEEILAESESEASDAEDGAPVVDAYAVTSSLLAVVQEVKLQSREFRQMSERLKPVEELVSQVAASRAKSAAPDTVNAPLLELLMDTVERLDRMVRVSADARKRLADAPPPGFLARLAGPLPGDTASAALTSTTDALQVAADRLRDELARLGARAIPCAGAAFDPERMSAVDSAIDATVPDGTVLEVLRGAWEVHGQTVRTARVRVSRRG